MNKKDTAKSEDSTNNREGVETLFLSQLVQNNKQKYVFVSYFNMR